MRLFKTLSADSDVEWEFIDGRYVKAHQHSTGMFGYLATNVKDIQLLVN